MSRIRISTASENNRRQSRQLLSVTAEQHKERPFPFTPKLDGISQNLQRHLELIGRALGKYLEPIKYN